MSTMFPESVAVKAWLVDWAAVSHMPLKTQEIVEFLEQTKEIYSRWPHREEAQTRRLGDLGALIRGLAVNRRQEVCTSKTVPAKV